MRQVCVLSIAALLASSALCQSDGAFEVVSVKPAAPGAVGRKNGAPGLNDPMLFSARNRTLKSLILMAYEIEDYQLSGGPGWIENVAFDIEARPAKPATPGEMLLMLRALLADRFQLAAHRESRPMTMYVLSVTKSGPKFGPQFHKIDPSAPFDPIVNKQGELPLPVGTKKAVARFLGLNMRTFDPEVGGVYRPDTPPVVDRTGLEGEYELVLHTDTREDWATMLERQAGLKLELRKVSIYTLAIDRAAKPSAN